MKKFSREFQNKVQNTEYKPFPIAVTVCKDCLKELQKQLKEQLDD